MTETGLPEGTRIIRTEPAFSMAEIDRCLLTVWRLDATSESFGLRHTELQDLATRYPGRCGYVEVIEPTSGPPNVELRRRAVEVFRKLGKDVSCVAFIIDGPQLRAAFARAILTGMTFLVPQMQPSKVFKRLPEGVAWVGTKVNDSKPAFETRLVAVFEHLRRQPST